MIFFVAGYERDKVSRKRMGTPGPSTNIAFIGYLSFPWDKIHLKKGRKDGSNHLLMQGLYARAGLVDD